MKTREIATVLAFNDAINAGDVERMSALMTADHTFVDSMGIRVCGADKMIEGWRDFFRMFPDYRNTIEGVMQKGDTVMAHGFASATYNGKRGLVAQNRIEMPASWKAVVADGRIREWRVYADWSEARRIIQEDQSS